MTDNPVCLFLFDYVQKCKLILCYLFNGWTLTRVVGLFTDRVHFMIGVVCDDVTADVVYDDVIAKGGDGDIS